MREILFRAKVIHNHFEKPDGTYRLPQGSWVYGCLIKDCNERPMIDIQGYVDGSGVHYQYYVDPETVGQFTGLHDKNNKKIYENDIIELTEKLIDGSGKTTYVGNVVCQKACFHFRMDKINYIILGYVDKKQIKIIGNIHDNPELMKGGNQ